MSTQRTFVVDGISYVMPFSPKEVTVSVAVTPEGEVSTIKSGLAVIDSLKEKER